ncbi:hypothetical protein DFP72DRAFT_909507 [Ephemerocybe angulata]|uniref:PARP catalytic domain-containing protein n=1 Tax=Ephemerocybe angulata TaxID=980116 RepID=A0A8H6M0H1_9AGAR|nr:hypothetical protein DFP72DRAFT_909507 [Tulosesus angulatus]
MASNYRGSLRYSSYQGSVDSLTDSLNAMTLTRKPQSGASHLSRGQPTGSSRGLQCVVCKIRPKFGEYQTCSTHCIKKVLKNGGDPDMCDYCHEKPRTPGKRQCGMDCIRKATVACLVCKCRPKNRRYQFCGRTCKRIAMEYTPFILSIPKQHVTYQMVAKKFIDSWKSTTLQIPAIREIYKINHDDASLQRYNEYKETVGNEQFLYHGTARLCQLGVATTELCASLTCVCNIVRTSFQMAKAKPTGLAFGKGIYTSSASNKAYRQYSGVHGAVVVSKVVLGKIKHVSRFNEVLSCPVGFNSVVYDRMDGKLNESVVYRDDAIRPVFLILFQ